MITVTERTVIEADQNADVPDTEGNTEAGMEMTVRTEVVTVHMRPEMVRVVMTAMEEAIMAATTMTAAEETIIAVTTVTATSQKHHSVRLPGVRIIEGHHRRTNIHFFAPCSCRRRQEPARQQHRQYCCEEPHDSLLLLLL